MASNRILLGGNKMKQENNNVTIFTGGGGYEIAYIGKEISPDIAEAVKQLINEGEKS